MLALLAVAPGGARGRGYLQDILWDGVSPEQASLGFRNALSVLRGELRKGLGFDPITADSQSVALDRDALWIDMLDTDALGDTFAEGPVPQILEGLNLRGAERPDFEDWLRRERLRGETLIETLRAKLSKPARSAEPIASTPAADPEPVGAHPGGVGLLPSIIVAGGVAGTALADAVLDSIANDLSCLGDVRIYDYRDQGGEGPTAGPGPKLLLRIKVLTDANQYAIQLSILRPLNNQLAGSSSVSGELTADTGIDGAVLSGFVGQNVDRILTWLAGPGDDVAAAAPYHALNTMFSFEDGSLNATSRLLTDAFEETGDPTNLGLLAYLETFRVGEHWGSYGSDVLERTREFCGRAIGAAGTDGLALGAAGHSVGYTLHDLETGGDLLHQAVHLNPAMAFMRDHLALNYIYKGDYQTARKAASDTLQVGAYSPLRFTYEATMCMASSLVGDDKRAVHFGNRALARRPRFGAALRYTAISLAHLGRTAEASALVDRITRMDPDFSQDWVRQGRMALLDDSAKERARKGLELAGVK